VEDDPLEAFMREINQQVAEAKPSGAGPKVLPFMFPTSNLFLSFLILLFIHPYLYINCFAARLSARNSSKRMTWSRF